MKYVSWTLTCLVLALSSHASAQESKQLSPQSATDDHAKPELTRSEATTADSEDVEDSGAEADVSTLTGQLADPDPNARAVAASRLGQLGPKAAAVVPLLIRALEDDGYPDVGEPVWILAAKALGKMGPEAVPQLIEPLGSPDPHVAKGAAAALGDIGPPAKEAVGPLIAALEKDDPETRITFMYALMGIGPDAKAAVPLLSGLLNHDDFHARYWACQALGGIGPPAAPAVPTLIKLTADAPASVRRHAAAALGNIGPAIGGEGLEALIKALRDPIDPVRQNAVEALGKLGDFAKPAVPEILAAIDGGKMGALTNSARTLWQLTRDPNVVVPVLVEDLNRFGTSPEAAAMLGELGEAAGPAVPELARSLESSDPVLRLAAAKALGQIGPAAKSAAPALQRAAEDESDDVRQAAQEALKQINPAGS